jgi:signal transduction histidine kinase/CheY-like chemotaxis protein
MNSSVPPNFPIFLQLGGRIPFSGHPSGLDESAIHVMSDLALLLVPLGVILLLALLYIERLDGGGALRLWRWGFVALYSAAVLVVDPAWKPGPVLAAPLNTAFVAFMFAGAMVFAGREVPGWLLSTTLAIGGLCAGMDALGYGESMSVVAILFAAPLFGASGSIVWRTARARGAGLAEHLLGPALLVFGALLCVTIGMRVSGMERPAALIALWFSTATGVAVLQILAGFDRARLREREKTRQLEDERRTLRAVVETAPLDIVLRGGDGRILMANRSAAARYDLQLDERGVPVVDQRLPDELTTRGSARPAAGGPGPLDADEMIEQAGFNLPDHGDETLQLFSSPVLSETGESLGRLFISRDVTEEHRLQQQLLQSQKMETLGTLAGGVAHDFNNQLTTILGNTRFALDELRADQTVARDCLTDLERAAIHCSELTQGLLAFARRTPSRTRALALETLIDEVERLLSALLPSTIALRVERPEHPWHPDADTTQLQQVLLNLAINSRDAIGDGGSITIRAENLEITQGFAVASGEAAVGPYVVFEVVDDGCGIDPQCIERIFDPFFTTKPMGEGTGLGLAIVYGVVTSHGGWLDVDSEPGHTSIRIGIPAKDPIPDAAAPPKMGPIGGGECLLLVDDEPALRRVVRSQLEGLGYLVIDAGTGEEALTLAARHHEIALAVLDYAMPGLNGLATLTKLRESRPGLPAVMISGYLDSAVAGHVETDIQLIQKPFDVDQLDRAIRTTLDGG